MLAMCDAGDGSAEETLAAHAEEKPDSWEDPDAYRGAFTGAVSAGFIQDTHALLQEHRRARGLDPWDFERTNEVLSKHNPHGHKNGGLKATAAAEKFRTSFQRTMSARRESLREFMVNIGDKLRHARHARNWNPNQLADHLKMHPVNVRQIEAGKRSRLAPETVAKLKKFFEEQLSNESGEQKARD
jgi:hypothetical protein